MINELLKKYPVISDQVSINELRIILNQLQLTLERNINGEIIEMGCYVGTTSLFISRMIKTYNSDKKFYVYDSFEGLPEKSHQDNSPAGAQFIAGELRASKRQIIENYKKANLAPPIIKKAWFSDLEDIDMPQSIAFAFLDGDYYESIQSCLKLIEDRLSPGATIIIDDYQNEALPGATKAVDEWLNSTGFQLKIEQSLAIIKVPI